VYGLTGKAEYVGRDTCGGFERLEGDALSCLSTLHINDPARGLWYLSAISPKFTAALIRLYTVRMFVAAGDSSSVLTTLLRPVEHCPDDLVCNCQLPTSGADPLSGARALTAHPTRRSVEAACSMLRVFSAQTGGAEWSRRNGDAIQELSWFLRDMCNLAPSPIDSALSVIVASELRAALERSRESRFAL
jgi:hypothetical protein